MSLTGTVVDATLKPDGTLELDQKLNLTPGRVQVIVQQLSKPIPAKPGLVEVMDEIRASQKATGYNGRTLEAMQAEEKDRQEEDAAYDQRCRPLLWG